MRDTMIQRTNSHQIKNKGQYRLVRIRDDGGQLYEAIGQQRTDRHIWLTGQECAEGVRAGMMGEIHYFHGVNFGKHMFVQKEQECVI